jgi:uncharacterized protein (DUF305 family)
MYAWPIVAGLACRLNVLLLAVIAGASCRTAGVDAAPPMVQPGAPGQASRTIAAEQAVDLSRVQHTAADVRFMQGMIHHHAQALDMTALLYPRTSREEMKLLARRIDISQADEIKMMQAWLTDRGEDAPDEHAHHVPGAPLMPGMLTADEMARLAAANGDEFDRLFLDFMIKHHAGAIAMVDELFASPGAGQESYIFAFASDVVADQRAEIERMAAMLRELQK